LSLLAYPWVVFALLLGLTVGIPEVENHQVSQENLARPAGLEPATL
jgi:hypothetical protein